MKNKRPLGIAGLTALLFLGLAVFHIHKQGLRTDLMLMFQIRSSHALNLELEVDRHTLKTGVVPGPEFVEVTFKLPRREVEKIRFKPGRGPAVLAIRTVTLKSLFKSHVWRGGTIGKLFGFRENVREIRGRREFTVEIEKTEARLNLSRTFCQNVNKAGGSRFIYYLMALILSGLVFGLVSSLKPGNLRLLLGSGPLSVAGLVFLIMLLFPLFNGVFRVVKPLDIQEKRALSPKPLFRLDAPADFPEQYRDYYNDHFILRNRLVRLNNLISFGLFRKSPVPMVILGKEGWLFMSRETDLRDEVDYYRNRRLFSPDELEHWNRILEERRLWLERQGIRYLFVVVPNKSTVYPEYMPDRIQRMGNPSRLDQLLEYTRKHSRVRILDLRGALIRAKTVHPVFHRTDSHWNDFGAYVAYTEIFKVLNALQEGEKLMPVSRFEIKTKNWVGGDLAAALSLEKEVIREDILEMIPRPPLTARTVARENLSRYVTRSLSVSPAGTWPGALMVHDSFIHEIRPFLAEHFSRMIFVWDWGLNVYPEIIRREKPWIVIEEMAERYLLDKRLSNPEPVSGSGK